MIWKVYSFIKEMFFFKFWGKFFIHNYSENFQEYFYDSEIIKQTIFFLSFPRKIHPKAAYQTAIMFNLIKFIYLFIYFCRHGRKYGFTFQCILLLTVELLGNYTSTTEGLMHRETWQNFTKIILLNELWLFASLFTILRSDTKCEFAWLYQFRLFRHR